MILRYRDKERVTSFSETIWPFLFFLVPSLFVFILFLADGQKATAVIAYVTLFLPYLLSMHSSRRATILFADILEKYERRVRELSGKDESKS